jgi:hypothetical protein
MQDIACQMKYNASSFVAAWSIELSTYSKLISVLTFDLASYV